MKKFYQLTQTGKEADLMIYGDITSLPWEEMGDVSAYNLSKELAELDVDRINVYINSYGGEVAEGLAIYNALKRHKARVVTVCDGFACSIASVIFMAGDERIMNESSLLLIHNAWSYASGDANQLRKEADDLDTINQAAITAYMAHTTISEEEVKVLMDAETWILPSDAVAWGFATAIESSEDSSKPSQNVRKMLFSKMTEKPGTPIYVQIDEDSIVQKLYNKLKQDGQQSAGREPEPTNSLMQMLAGFFHAEN